MSVPLLFSVGESRRKVSSEQRTSALAPTKRKELLENSPEGDVGHGVSRLSTKRLKIDSSFLCCHALGPLFVIRRNLSCVRQCSTHLFTSSSCGDNWAPAKTTREKKKRTRGKQSSRKHVRWLRLVLLAPVPLLLLPVPLSVL